MARHFTSIGDRVAASMSPTYGARTGPRAGDVKIVHGHELKRVAGGWEDPYGHVHMNLGAATTWLANHSAGERASFGTLGGGGLVGQYTYAAGQSFYVDDDEDLFDEIDDLLDVDDDDDDYGALGSASLANQYEWAAGDNRYDVEEDFGAMGSMSLAEQYEYAAGDNRYDVEEDFGAMGSASLADQYEWAAGNNRYDVEFGSLDEVFPTNVSESIASAVAEEFGTRHRPRGARAHRLARAMAGARRGSGVPYHHGRKLASGHASKLPAVQDSRNVDRRTKTHRQGRKPGLRLGHRGNKN